MIYRATFLALLVAVLPGMVPIAASAASVSMDVTNTSKYEVHATAERDGVAKFYLYVPSMGNQKVLDTGTYVLKGYALVNGLKVELPNLPLQLSGTAPIVLIISESGKKVSWGTRAGTQSGAWY